MGKILILQLLLQALKMGKSAKQIPIESATCYGHRLYCPIVDKGVRNPWVLESIFSTLDQEGSLINVHVFSHYTEHTHTVDQFFFVNACQTCALHIVQ